MSPQAPNPFSLLVRDHLAYISRHRFARLRFPSTLEERFEHDIAPARARRFYLEAWLLTGAFLLILGGDFLSQPARIHLNILRGLIVLPIMVAVNELQRHHPRPFLREASIVFSAGCVALSSFFVYHNLSVAMSASTQIALLTCLLASNVIMRVRFPYAAAATAFCILSDVVYLLADSQLSTPEKIHAVIPVAWGALFILFAAYTLEHEERRAYLLHLRNDMQGEELSALNQELDRLSRLDPLTGLGNRATFDRQLDVLWREAHRNQTPLSVVLVDIDHFKITNDTFGHLYGDEVIRRVAALVEQSVRGKEDVAARFGGEEFVLLLPDTPHAVALRIAERVRCLVQVAGSPPPPADTQLPMIWNTVSAGVATLVPTLSDTPRQLIHSADVALYAAKAAGRNTVQSALDATIV